MRRADKAVTRSGRAFELARCLLRPVLRLPRAAASPVKANAPATLSFRSTLIGHQIMRIVSHFGHWDIALIDLVPEAVEKH